MKRTGSIIDTSSMMRTFVVVQLSRFSLEALILPYSAPTESLPRPTPDHECSVLPPTWSAAMPVVAVTWKGRRSCSRRRVTLQKGEGG